MSASDASGYWTVTHLESLIEAWGTVTRTKRQAYSVHDRWSLQIPGVIC